MAWDVSGCKGGHSLTFLKHLQNAVFASDRKWMASPDPKPTYNSAKKNSTWKHFCGGFVIQLSLFFNAFTKKTFFRAVSFVQSHVKNLKAACWHFNTVQVHYFESVQSETFLSVPVEGTSQCNRTVPVEYGTKRHCPVDTMLKNEKKLAHLVCCTCP